MNIPLDLQNFRIPRNLSSKVALDLALALTGHRRETDLARYLALALHYLSWALPAEASLQVYSAHLKKMAPSSAQQLLDVLTFPLSYALKAEVDSLPAEVVTDAQRASSTWRQQLVEKNADVLKLHARSIDLLNDTLGQDEHSQRMIATELRMKSMVRNPPSGESASIDPHSKRLTSADLVALTGGAALLPQGDPEVEPIARKFSNPEEALHFLMAQMIIRSNFRTPLMNGQVTSAPAPAGAQPSVAEELSTVRVPASGQVQVFRRAEVIRVLQKMPPPAPQEGNMQQRRILEIMASDGGFRQLTQVPAGDPLAQMYARFPHFHKVLDFISRSLAFAACGDEGQPAQISPILLRGVPGTGKTYFAQELAAALGSHYVERDLSVVSDALVITGMDSTYKNSKPGLVFEALVNGKTANPVVCLNEVDKVKLTGNNNSPVAALYALLEPTSSERFIDEFIPVTLDASHVVWILTANDGDIPVPILSRLETFDILLPTRDQCRAIASSVWATLCSKAMPKGHGFAVELPALLVDAVSALSPRVMRRALTHAVGIAATEKRKQLTHEDFLSASNTYAESPKGRIGFMG